MSFSFKEFFSPKDRKFTPLFKEESMYLKKAGELFEEMICASNEEQRMELIQTIYKLEIQNDEITHNIKKALSQTFITPFDREDIYQLATLVDDVIDLINMVAKKIKIYQLDTSGDESMKKLAKMVKDGCWELHIILENVSSVKKEIFKTAVKIHTIENQADELHDKAVQELFDLESDMKILIKRKEVYKGMEQITDKCEDVVHVMESIHIKYS